MTPSKGGPVDVHEGRATVQRDGPGEARANWGPTKFRQEQWAVLPWLGRDLEIMLVGIRESPSAQLPSALMKKYLH